MHTVSISKRTADRLQRLAEKRRRADDAAEAARVEFMRAVEAARRDGGTLNEIGQTLAITRQRVHQLLRG